MKRMPDGLLKGRLLMTCARYIEYVPRGKRDIGRPENKLNHLESTLLIQNRSVLLILEEEP